VGLGTVTLPAYGVGDAEARVEKEIGTALPGSVTDVREIRRSSDQARIVEEYRVSYRVKAEVEGEGADEESARRSAFAAARALLLGTRYSRTAWERADLIPP
jgi:hypothetical protein